MAHTAIHAHESLARLSEGNARFASGTTRHPHSDEDRRLGVSSGQAPFAAVFSCADSRVPPEIVFDCGLGDLFVVRSAGQMVENAVLASLEFAVHELSVPLILVLGHEGCGAVAAAESLMAQRASGAPLVLLPGHLNALAEQISRRLGAGSGETHLKTPALTDAPRPMTQAARNTAAARAEVCARSPLIRAAHEAGDLELAHAIYDLETGRVTFSGTEN
ncbi:carbonic anhydrase [Dermabacter vaginalis]|uniref:carbonic anhydrase n=1 Tax=Dermabacter TaxID=36739 RepID=UPI002024E794|nr:MULTISPECIES: carbonic anhydrase [Dermabacter]MCT2150418.1 carbonic anhydrase [Dermabacter vaginalis]